MEIYLEVLKLVIKRIEQCDSEIINKCSYVTPLEMTNSHFNWEETKETLLDIIGSEECCLWGELAIILEKFSNAMKEKYMSSEVAENEKK